MSSKILISCALVALCCTTFSSAVPLTAAANDRFAYLHAVAGGSGGIQRSTQPIKQVYANDFLRLIFDEEYTILMNFVCRPFYYDITDQNSLVYCK